MAVCLSGQITRTWRPIIGLGLLSWLIPFAVSFFAYPLKSQQPPLFDNLLAVVLTSTAVLLGLKMIRSSNALNPREAAGIGLLWWAINIGCDLLLFTWGPMAMPTITYLRDIGLAYSAYPIILFGLATASHSQRFLTQKHANEG